jgi:glycosyltransferase involved in cell wall biosynthesis
MRVLLSAYACEPDRGSEPEIGWQRVLHMCARAEEVWVITRSNNRAVIEASASGRNANLHFIYFDLPTWMLKLKKRAWFFPLYLVFWQWGAYRIAAAYHRVHQFDAVYHITFSTIRFGSFMGRLRIPFIVGPIAGGERAPFRLRKSMPIKCKMKELLRDFGIVFQRYSPLTRSALSAADRIYVTTSSSLLLISSKWHYKTLVQLSIAICGSETQTNRRELLKSPRFVFAGRLVYWKGVHFAIRALAEARKSLSSATLTLIGSGPDEPQLRDLAIEYKVADAVKFTGQLPRQQLVNSLSSYTAFVFPSLHDSGGSVVLEALQKGVPVICLDLGGPGVMVNACCGIAVSTSGADETKIVAEIASAMISLAQMPAKESELLSSGAIARANELSWTALTERVTQR